MALINSQANSTTNPINEAESLDQRYCRVKFVDMTVQAMLVFASIIRCVESVMCTNKSIYLFLPKKKKCAAE